MLMCVKLNSLFYREMQVFFVTQVFKEDNNIRTKCHNYIFELRNTNSIIASLSKVCRS